VFPWSLSSAQARSKRPNILFVSIDDLNDWAGVTGGHPQARTPHLDALAARGRSFLQAHCNAPICNPSRTSTLTGVAPHVSGVYNNQAAWWQGVKGIPTLPTLLGRHGYSTIGAGKVFHFGDPAAWDRYMGDPCDKAHVEDRARPRKSDHKHVSELSWGPARSDRPDIHPDEKVAAWVSGELGAKHDKPFFLACGFYKPHLAWIAPRAHFDALPVDDVILPEVPEDELEDIPEQGRRLAHIQIHEKVIQRDAWKEAVRAYLAAVSFIDAQLGRVLAALEAGPHRDNTVVVVWSDHGWSLGEKFHWKKNALWEECTRVPLVFAGPGIQPGACSRVVSLVDLYPTLAAMGRAPLHDKAAGHNLAPLLSDPTTPWPHHCLTSHAKGGHAIRTERWRYIRYADGTHELYDHTADPGEHQNIADRPDVKPVVDRLGALIPKTSAPPVEAVTRKCRK
jgi:arylsulfatase A-like enzyme